MVGLGSLSGGEVLIAGGAAGCTDCFQDDAEFVGASLLAIPGINSVLLPDTHFAATHLNCGEGIYPRWAAELTQAIKKRSSESVSLAIALQSIGDESPRYRFHINQLLALQSLHFLIKRICEFLPIARMVAASMAIRTQCNCVAFAISTLLCQMLNVMNFKIWLSIHFERSRLPAAFADTLSVIENPTFDFGVSNKVFGYGHPLLRRCIIFRFAYEVRCSSGLYVAIANCSLVRRRADTPSQNSF